MSRMTAISVRVLAFQVTLLCANSNAGDLSCVQEMLLPGYGSIARKAKAPGSVEVVLTIGEHGKLQGLSTSTTDKFLAQEVEVFLKFNTIFSPECSGKSVVLVFTFALRGEPVENPTVRVSFKGPNEFVFVSQPELPIIDRFTDPPTKRTTPPPAKKSQVP